jgi:hypothetical protein
MRWLPFFDLQNSNQEAYPGISSLDFRFSKRTRLLVDS